MVRRVSLPSATTSRAPFRRLLTRKCSISTQPTIQAVSRALTSARKKCQPWTALSASKTTLDSSGTALTVRSLADRVSAFNLSNLLYSRGLFFPISERQQTKGRHFSLDASEFEFD